MKYTPFEYSVLKFVKDNALVLPRERIVLAVSGGADSVALMYVMVKLRAELKADFFVAHLNHMIRKEAAQEGKAVKEMAEALEIPCLVGKKDVPSFRNAYSLSLEEAARIKRYEFFEEALNFFRADKIATAHHLSDLAENFFIRLFRGSGVGGLVGMRAKNGRYIKPFLFLDEGSIREYVTIRRLKHFEDKTNEDIEYLRNRIRHKLMPLVKSDFCADVENKIWRSVRILEEYQDFVRSKVEWIMQKGREDGRGRLFFRMEYFKNEPLLVKELTKELLWRKGIQISSRKLNAVATLIKRGGEVKLSRDFFALKCGDNLVFGEKPFFEGWESQEFSVPARLKIEELELSLSVELRQGYESLGDGKKIAVVDAEKVSFPLNLRIVKPDDEFVPLGAKEKRKVMSFLKSRKIPHFLRTVYPVVSQKDGKIIWVVGVAISEEFKVTPKTKKTLVFGREGGNFF